MKTVIPSTIAALHGTLPCADLQQSAMGWGQWMVPEVSPELEFRVRANMRLAIRDAMSKTPEDLEELMVSVTMQNEMLKSVVSKATHHIAGLEAREALNQPASNSGWDFLQMARDLVPIEGQGLRR